MNASAEIATCFGSGLDPLVYETSHTPDGAVVEIGNCDFCGQRFRLTADSDLPWHKNPRTAEVSEGE